jgi:hypothetical protein
VYIAVVEPFYVCRSRPGCTGGQLASGYVRECMGKPNCRTPYNCCKAASGHPATIIGSRLYYQILFRVHHEQPLVDNILRKTGWTMATFQGVDWDSHHCAFHKLMRFQCIGISKLVHNLSNTNRQNCLLYGTSDRCPGCGEDDETFEHVVHCSFGTTILHCNEALVKLDKSLVAMETPQQVVRVIMEGFRDWLDPDFPPDCRSWQSTFGSL